MSHRGISNPTGGYHISTLYDYMLMTTLEHAQSLQLGLEGPSSGLGTMINIIVNDSTNGGKGERGTGGNDLTYLASPVGKMSETLKF